MEYKKVENTEEALSPPGTVIRNDGGEGLHAYENSWGLTGISGYHRAELLVEDDHEWIILYHPGEA